MKFILAFTMLLSLIAAFLLIQLGFQYVDEGQGLHPVASGIGMVVVLAMGYAAASLLASEEN